jgi:hypothetical protein
MFPYPAGNTAAIPDVPKEIPESVWGKYRKAFGRNTGRYLDEISKVPEKIPDSAAGK